jgi:hypothetical protein
MIAFVAMLAVVSAMPMMNPYTADVPTIEQVQQLLNQQRLMNKNTLNQNMFNENMLKQNLLNEQQLDINDFDTVQDYLDYQNLLKQSKLQQSLEQSWNFLNRQNIKQQQVNKIFTNIYTDIDI